MKQTLLALALPLPLVFAACETTPHGQAAAADSAAQDKSDAGDEADSKADKLTKAERELANAQIELKIAQKETESALRKAQDDVVEAEHDAQAASDALQRFLQFDLELELSKAQLDVDRAAWSLEAEKQELAELEAMYKKDDVATLTKELVIQRGRKGVEFATRGLDHEQREAAAKRDYELPKKQRDLEQDKREADNKLREARAEKDKTSDEVELKLRKARAEVEDAEKALSKARGKAAEAKP
jgi:hypothetical protein